MHKEPTMPKSEQEPTILIIPGLSNSGPNHWQTKWEERLPDTVRAELGGWDSPRKSAWITNLGIAIRQIAGPKILVAHSLGCHAVAWWAKQEPEAAELGVTGALLVAPPDVDSVAKGSKLADFGPAPRTFLPFPSLLVGSLNDPYCAVQHAQKLARRWRARFVNAGLFGHINAESDIGDWPYGLSLLDTLKFKGNPINNPALVARIENLRAQRSQTGYFV
jgi:predicted alpha/beta hydrolase family esterase